MKLLHKLRNTCILIQTAMPQVEYEPTAIWSLVPCVGNLSVEHPVPATSMYITFHCACILLPIPFSWFSLSFRRGSPYFWWRPLSERPVNWEDISKC
jgi:hypothetical protein